MKSLSRLSYCCVLRRGVLFTIPTQQGPLVEAFRGAFRGLLYWSDFAPWLAFEGVTIVVHELELATLEKILCPHHQQFESNTLASVFGRFVTTVLSMGMGLVHRKLNTMDQDREHLHQRVQGLLTQIFGNR